MTVSVSLKVAYVLSLTLMICLTAQIYFLNAIAATSVVRVNTTLAHFHINSSNSITCLPARWFIAHQAIVT